MQNGRKIRCLRRREQERATTRCNCYCLYSIIEKKKINDIYNNNNARHETARQHCRFLHAPSFPPHFACCSAQGSVENLLPSHKHVTTPPHVPLPPPPTATTTWTADEPRKHRIDYTIIIFYYLFGGNGMEKKTVNVASRPPTRSGKRDRTTQAREGGRGCVWKERKPDDSAGTRSPLVRVIPKTVREENHNISTRFSHSLAQYFLLRRYVLHVRPLGRRRRGRGADDAVLLSLFHVAHGRVEYQHLIGPDHVGRHTGDDNEIAAVLRTETRRRRRRRRWLCEVDANREYDTTTILCILTEPSP